MYLGAGVEVWFAEYEVLTGNYESFEEELNESLEEALENCTHAILFTNHAWQNSPYCKIEAESLLGRLNKNEIIQICSPLEEYPSLKIQSDKELNTIIFNQNNVSNILEYIFNTFKIKNFSHIPNYSSYIKNYQSLSFRYGSINTFPLNIYKKLPPASELGWVGRMHEFVYGGKILGIWNRLEINIDPYNSPIGLLSFTDFWDKLKTDDRAVYTKLRERAYGYIRQNKLKENGLHLYIHEGQGHIGLTYYSFGKTDPSYISWHRFYSFTINDDKYNKPVTITLEFTVFNKGIAFEKAKRNFYKLVPFFNAMVGNFKYTGDSSLQFIPPKSVVAKKKRMGSVIGGIISIPIGVILFVAINYYFLQLTSDFNKIIGVILSCAVCFFIGRAIGRETAEYFIMKEYFDSLLSTKIGS